MGEESREKGCSRAGKEQEGENTRGKRKGEKGECSKRRVREKVQKEEDVSGGKKRGRGQADEEE